VSLYEDNLANSTKLLSILNEDASAHTAVKPPVYGEYSMPNWLKRQVRASIITAMPYRESYSCQGMSISG
jgi:hypothetical protein